ncbi:hypothetical protein GCM10008164_43980 [Achromobacter xylosoxidans]|nr:hypothetical protein GCM10008164_43980 [Achromobacter xylosoxidans]
MTTSLGWTDFQMRGLRRPGHAALSYPWPPLHGVPRRYTIGHSCFPAFLRRPTYFFDADWRSGASNEDSPL